MLHTGHLFLRRSFLLIICTSFFFLGMGGVACADLITAHSADTISRTDEIQVQFARPMVKPDQVNQPVGTSPLTFEPRIKGIARWKTRSTLAFEPANWLPSDQKYKATLNFKAIPTAPQKPPFTFQFATRPQAFEISLEGFTNDNRLDLNQLTLSGTLQLADTATDKDVERMLTAHQGKSKRKVQWFHATDKREHRFTISGIQKGDTISALTLQWDGSPIGAKQGFQSRFEVPAAGAFRALEARTVHSPERYIELLFSDPLDPDQQLDGLITIPDDDIDIDESQFRFTIADNRIRVYSSEQWWGEMSLRLHPGIRNLSGDRLAQERDFSLTFEDLKPQVRFVGKRSILPTTRGLTIPIETANLHAVVLSVIHIPDDNLAQFLQVNTLDEGKELNRVGRPVVRRIVPLNYTEGQKNRWVRHGLDVQDLIDKHPSGMFRIELAFWPEHMVYDCPGRNSGDAAPIVATDLPLDGNWDEQREKSNWDNWAGAGNYSWRDLYQGRKNPCHPGYFRKYNDHSIGGARNVLISDIGLIAKKGQNDAVNVAVANLKSALPLAGVELTLFDYQQQVLTTGRSDGQGMAVLRTDRKPFLLVARHRSHGRDQYAYMKMDDGSALAVSHFDVGGQTVKKGLKGFIYGERGVWRPGDPIHLTFVLQDDGDRLPADHPVIFELRDPKGWLSDKQVARKARNGFYAFTTETIADAPTGGWTATVRVGGATFEKKIKIETIVPNRLKIALDLGKEATLYSGGRTSGQLSGTLSSTWLHGAIARNLKADIRLTFTQRLTRFPGYDAYTFDDPVRTFQSEQHLLFEGKLDEKGQTPFAEQFEMDDEAPGMLTAHLETRVFEPGGAFSTERHSLPFHPYARYVGLQPPKGDAARGMLLTDTKHTVQLAMVDDHGRPVPDAQAQIQLYKINWRWWWEKGKENFANFHSSRAYKLLKEDTVRIENGKGQWQFQVNYPDWGRYMIRVKDTNGRHVSGKIIYMDWPGWAGRGQKEIPGAAAVLSFAADKPTYRVGETVTLTIPTSVGGRGLVSIENGSRVLAAKWIDGKADATRYRFTATADMVPNIYAHVTFVQPHMQTANDHPIRMYGVIPIGIEDPQSHLAPVIETKEEFAPEEPATIRVQEKNGRPMTYTVAVVDEGLLGITRFQTPNPWDHFYKREALGVKTWDLYDQVAGAYGGVLEQLLAIGGDDAADAAGAKKANRFPPVVRFLGPFDLAPGAQASHQVQIPRYVGQVRVMVVAGHNGAYGAAQRSVFVRKPLMVLATLPRVISTGESVRLPVSVFAMDEKIKRTTVSVKALGMLNVVQGARSQLNFDGPGDQLAFFRLRAGNRPGIARLDIMAQGGGITARQTIEIDVRLPSQPVTDSRGTTLKKEASWDDEIPFPGLVGTNQITLEVSRIPPLNLDKRLNYLSQYPHGCVEQITSTAFPQLFLDQLLDLSPQRQAQVQTNVSSAIARLRNFQKSSGGFGYWPADEDVNAWATNYVGHFLVTAKDHGYLIPSQVLDTWRDFQRKRANNWQDEGERSDLIQAYRLYTLALDGNPALGAMNRLREASQISTVARWRLAAAYQLAGQTEAATALVAKADVTVTPYRELANTFGSDLRDKAMILEAILLMDRNDETLALIREISTQLSSDRSLSTQTTAYALLAMARAAGVAGGRPGSQQMDFTYSWNDRSPQTIRSTRPIVQIRLAEHNKTAGRIRLNNRGQGLLYPRIIATGTPAPGSETAAENGLKIETNYYSPQGDQIDISKLEQGTDFIAQIIVTNTSEHENYHELALTQMIPSGWEIHAMRMTQAAGANGGRYRYQDVRDASISTYFDLKPRQSVIFGAYLTAAYEGRFYLPMMSAEAMYDAAINARLPGQWVQVVRQGPSK